MEMTQKVFGPSNLVFKKRPPYRSKVKGQNKISKNQNSKYMSKPGRSFFTRISLIVIMRYSWRIDCEESDNCRRIERKTRF